MLKVYKNLKKGCWSIKQKGVPVWHADSISIKFDHFKVSEKRRLHVLAGNWREVHAWAIGTECAPVKGSVRVSYNPYKMGSFYECESGKAIHSCKAIEFRADGTAWAVV